MRELLFRGIMNNDNSRCKRGQWVFGDLVRLQDGNDGKPHIYGYGEVLPKTVGQYTGLTDKNGKKIFEGDILNTSNSNCRIWYVDYKNTAFCCNQGNANYSCVLDEFMQYSSVEVIGNIHDNPEHLKESEE